MKPETQKFLNKARSDLADAKKIAAIELANIAARAAYYSVDPSQSATVEEATGAIASAERFIAVVTELLKDQK